MYLVDRVLRRVAPERALARARSRAALDALMNYEAARADRRNSSVRISRSDADSAGAHRGRIAAVARDLIRNTPLASRAQMVLASNVVGNGIIPKIIGGSEATRSDLLRMIEDHLDTTAIDAHGQANLYGLQRLVVQAVADAGEVLIRRRRREATDGMALPFQIEVLEADHLDTSRDGVQTNGNLIRDGIEYDQIGRRVAYWLYREHPGAVRNLRARFESRRVPASEVLHVFRQDRPGQMRGVSWFAPVALSIMDLHDWQDAQLVRQKIAACFTVFVQSDAAGDISDRLQLAETLSPGRIQHVPADAQVSFGMPPRAEGGEFVAQVMRLVAAGLGITYEALTGDMTGVNFTSGRMARQEMRRNVEAWQNLMMIPQMCAGIGAWTLEAYRLRAPRGRNDDVRIGWVPPAPVIVDPAREIPAVIRKVRGSLTSLSGAIRELGEDPERVMEEIARDNKTMDRLRIHSDSDPRRVSTSGVAQSVDPLDGDGDGE